MDATPAQLGFVRSLLAQRVCSTDVLDRAGRIETLSRRQVSDLISDLKAAPYATARAPRAEVPEGMHKIADGRIFKVQKAVHGSGRKYAKELIARPLGTCGGCEACDGEDVCRKYDVAFHYAQGAMSLLSDDTLMTLAEARAFGALYGTCCQCGRTLTDETSIANGIGPVCEGRFAR